MSIPQEATPRLIEGPKRIWPVGLMFIVLIMMAEAPLLAVPFAVILGSMAGQRDMARRINRELQTPCE